MIPDHYDRVSDVYETLGQIEDGLYCPGNRDFYGWYNTRGGRGRAYALGKEWPAIREELDRVVYSTVNYARKEWFLNAWEPYTHGENGKEWASGDAPTPGYGDLRAYAIFADIDLADDVKQRRTNGEIPKEAVEQALGLYIDAFADLAGDRSHVYALDSVGGAYVMLAPTTTQPIAEAFPDDDRRALVFEELASRANDWLSTTKASVNETVPAAVDVFEPDLLNNKNRLYKAPMSVHSSLDGVVTPVDNDSPSYDYTPLQTVETGMITDAVEWAEQFTEDHTGAVSNVVAGLWPEYYPDANDWEVALANWADDKEQEQQKNEQRGDQGLSNADITDGLETTDDIEVINTTIEAIDVTDVARDVADAWDTAPGRNPPRFDPPWRNSDSGQSCFADSDKFVDLAEGANGGGALKLIARARGIITDSSYPVDGEDYWRAINELRAENYDIPRFEGHDGKHPDVLKLYDEPDNKEQEREQFLKALKL